MTEWWQGRLVGFDLESTSASPEDARIVTAAIVLCGGGLATESLTLMADPGVAIPDEAVAIHGVTNERARDEGLPAAEVVGALIDLLAQHAGCGYPLAVFNARYDMTVLDREARRHGIVPLSERGSFSVVDPACIDRQLDRYRRSYPRGMTPEQAAEQGIPSSRTLAGMCKHYGARLDDAHAADADAIAAARLAWCIGARGQVVRRVRGREDAIEKARLVKEWEACRHDLARLHAAQQRWALAERVRFAEYKRSIGEHDEAARIEQERGWPVLEVMAHEAAA